MEIISVLIAIIGLAILSKKEHKKGNNDMIPLVYWALMISCMAFLTVYILDKFNLPTKWGWTQNLVPQNWLGFIGNYLTGILTTIVNVLFLVGVTNIQLNHSRKENMESLRIQNIPILKFNIDDDKYNVGMFDCIWTTLEKKTTFYFNVSIKNVGANTIRSLKVDVEHNINAFTTQRIIGNKGVECLEKGETISKNKMIELDSNNNIYNMKLIAYYEDVLTNWYKQEVWIEYFTTPIVENGKNMGAIYFNVKNEQQIKKEDVPKLEIIKENTHITKEENNE